MCIATLLAASQSMQVASEVWNSAITVPQPPSSTVHVNSSGILLTGPPTMESRNHSCWPDEDTHMMMVLGGASRIQDEDVPTWQTPTANVPTWQAPTADVPTWPVPTADVPTWPVPTADVPTWQDRAALFETTWVVSMLLQCTYQWKEDHKPFGTVYKAKHASSVTTNEHTDCTDIGYTCACGNKWQISANETAYCCKNWYIGRENKYIGHENECIGHENECIGRENECIGRENECIGRENECIGRENECIGRENECIGCKNEYIGHVNKYIDHENENEYIGHEMKESSVEGNWTPSVAWLPDWSSDYFMTSFSSFLSILA